MLRHIGHHRRPTFNYKKLRYSPFKELTNADLLFSPSPTLAAGDRHMADHFLSNTSFFVCDSS
ncbi:Carbamoylphosphate synthase small subunit [Pseudomonas syringae pv. actinidiae]|uniref:Carbamoylphosphate synthase small subunit n=1 Tax=Pseudomonas syringae pv. actinidiae TaxID=103796 RepID=A0A2V0QAX3_PSESF|nr:Carbamoylphosphate synthase small subunit [Pseudomonas syringae pv. actinidiae]